MNNVFFTSDTHFGHDGLIKHGHRKLNSIKDSDELIIKNWNSVVGKNDTVYHLGDFAWHSIAEYRKRLNGHIHLIRGNHDRLNAEAKNCFESINDIKEIKVDGQRIVLCHFAMRVWNGSHRGAFHLYGHSHGSLPENPNSLSFDVGVDCNGFIPLHYDQIKARMAIKNYQPCDHHKPASNEAIEE